MSKGRRFGTIPVFLRPPGFASRLEEARARTLAPILILTVVVAAVALATLPLSTGDEPIWLIAIIYSLLFGMPIASGLLLRAGRIRTAGAVYSICAWLTTVVTIATYGVLESYVMVVAMAVVLVSGFVWDERAAVIMALAYSLLGLVMLWGQEAGVLQLMTREMRWWRQWLGFTASLATGAMLLMFGIRRVAASLQEVSRSETLVRASRERLRQLADRLESVREEERRSIARTVHDELGQTLTALRLDLMRLLPKEVQDTGSEARSMLGHIDRMIDVVRNLSARLRPDVLDTLGLTAALEWEAEQFRERSGVECRVESEVDERSDEVDPECATALFRIVQEALTNIARHSAANNAWIRLRRGRRTLHLEVLDDGQGIADEWVWSAGSSGLIGIRERAGNLRGTVEIERRPEGGTRLAVRVPIGTAAPESA